MQSIKLCHLDAVLPGTSLGFSLGRFGNDDFFLVNKSGKIFGYRNSCPHWPGSTMPHKRHQYLDDSASLIVCSGHGARFDIESGICVAGPCIGEYLTAVNINIGADGNIYLLQTD